MSAIDRWWGLILLGGFIAGGFGTLAVLRLQLRATQGKLQQRVTTGEIIWGCHVRERQLSGRYGLSGTLVLSADLGLVLNPDGYSRKRGAQDEHWSRGTFIFTLSAERRDISGAVAARGTLDLGAGHLEKRFACAGAVGTLPDLRSIV